MDGESVSGPNVTMPLETTDDTSLSNHATPSGEHWSPTREEIPFVTDTVEVSSFLAQTLLASTSRASLTPRDLMLNVAVVFLFTASITSRVNDPTVTSSFEALISLIILLMTPEKSIYENVLEASMAPSHENPAFFRSIAVSEVRFAKSILPVIPLALR